MLIRHAEIARGAVFDLRIIEGRISQIGKSIDPLSGEPVLAAHGGALLPGLHDHHLHLFALAAAETSIRCGPPEVHSEAQLRAAVTAARADEHGWLRGVGYHESVAGPLDRARLDEMGGERPLRIQHRSGRMWFLNSAGLALLARHEGIAGSETEQEPSGVSDGRLHNGDAWLRDRLGARPFPGLARTARRLASLGVTGLTDATPDNGDREVRALQAAILRGELPQRLRIMGGAELPPLREERLRSGELKILLEESSLPDLESLCARIRAAHHSQRAVAIHSVTRSEIFYAIAALEEAGGAMGDRIEHASVAPAEAIRALSRLGACVVTQPNFLRERGDRYRLEVAAVDRPFLYRGRGWLDAGVPLGGGTDAPFGDPDPWAAMAAAVDRRSAGGHCFDPLEAVSPEQALALFTSSPEAPGGPPRPIEVGGVADLCLLDRPWSRAREILSREAVRATLCAGEIVWQNDVGAAA